MKTLFSLICTLQLCIAFGQSWETATSPPAFLSDHSFGFSIDGKGYLVAGTEESFGPTDKFFQYDPAAEIWIELDPFPGEGRGYAIGDVWERKAYFGFGTSVDSLLRDLWVFDADSMKWSQLASCPCDARTHPAMVALNGKVFVGMGSGNSGNMNDWWEYDIATDLWTQKSDFPGVKRHHPYQFGLGDFVYAGFGHGQGIFKDWYRFDPATNTWEQMADLPAEGRVAGTQFSNNGKGYVLSGDGDDHLSMEEGEFWEYDPEANSWTQLPSHPGKSRWAPASFIIDDVVYLFNGTSYFEGAGYFYQEEAYKYDLEPIIIEDDMLETGKQWIFEYIEYSISFPYSDTTIETITVTKDTSINSKTYKKLELSSHPVCWNTGDVEYLREEGERIYRLSRDLEEEFLMIDFNEDSTYTMLFDNMVGIIDTGIVIVDSFGTDIAFDGTLLEVQYLKILNNQSFDDDMPYKVYRDVGFLYPGLLFPDVGTGLCDLQSDITLRCVIEGQDTIHFTDLDCFELQVISSVDPVHSDAFSISPNPASNELNIDFEGVKTSSLNWKITDVGGRIIKTGKLNGNNQIEQINIADIAAGFYFFTLDRYSKLLVIQK
jgi:N-acetylneuraminic acid mutarotase